MTLKRHLAELQLEQDADLACLRIQTRAALRAASPRRLIQKHPYISAGAAIVIGMKLAPAPRRSAASSAPGSVKKNFFTSIVGWFPMLLSLFGNGMPIVPPESPKGGSSPHPTPVTMPSPVLSVVQGIQLLLSVFESRGNAEPKGSLEVIFANAGSLNANDLPSHLAT